MNVDHCSKSLVTMVIVQFNSPAIIRAQILYSSLHWILKETPLPAPNTINARN